jgi:hypothetical protein
MELEVTCIYFPQHFIRKHDNVWGPYLHVFTPISSPCCHEAPTYLGPTFA